MNSYIEINGIYEKTIRRNEKNGYTFFTIKPISTLVTCMNPYGTVSCYGAIPPFIPGTPLQIKGKVMKKNTFYICVSDIKESYNQKDTMIAYLQSEYFPGIGEKTAKKIVEVFGSDLENII